MTDQPFSPSAADLGYAGLALERAGDNRHDPAFIAVQQGDGARRMVVFAGERPMLKAACGALELLFDAAEAAALGAAEPWMFLGRSDGGPVFAVQLPAETEPAPGTFVEDLRALATDGRLAGEPLALAGLAKSMLSWHARHGFCANCGAATDVAGGGWRRECPSCGTQHFPRVDPVVIMLVTIGDRCLLGRQPRFPEGMWSCLAGFVEPGETIEAAARREIMEEAGVAIGSVGYAFSQPWPFPSQLMLGVVAKALGDELTVDRSELDDARWFTRDEVARLLTGEHELGLSAPPPAAIAHHLLQLFARG
ncbi:NAD(+) diphosphatase [Hansschlegelia plantiphila]|uniref:NAD(+) diphosphatase n=1 Tax=Hansschlegelia plantiphila TaxID=374655 RepID=A0A9W6MW81_9HYPH|nr:NAD(+) diphosphatase [Hansschlegelia plantiphila]GLK68788.1 NADH pyrophosphatase [Hansschlegelia plantiphila]